MTSPETPRSPTTTLLEQDWKAAVERHGRKLAVGGGVVVLAAAAIWMAITSGQRKETLASLALQQARAAAETGNLPLATNDLNQLISRYRGSNAAFEASILLNQLRLLQGQNDLAVQSLRELAQSRAPDHVRASAFGLMAGGLEDQGKGAEAGAAYLEAARFARMDFLKAQYLLDAGRALVAAGDSAGARSALLEILTVHGELDQAAEARVRLAEIGGEVPQPTRSARN